MIAGPPLRVRPHSLAGVRFAQPWARQ